MTTPVWTRRLAGTVLAATLALSDLAFAQQQPPIVIGVILTLSGPPGRAGNREKDGAMLAVERINAAGGIKGRKIELVIRDDGADPNGAVIAFNALAARDDVIAVFGSTIGSATMAFAPLAKRAGMPLLAPNSTYEITRLNNEFVFRVAVPGDVEVKAAYDLAKKKNLNKIAILHSNDAYGKQGADLMKAIPGINIVAEESFATSSTDYTPQLTKIRAANPEVLMVWGGTPFTGTAVKNAGQLGITVPIISPTAAGSLANVAAAAGSPAMANWIIAGVIDPASPLPRQEAAFALFREKYKADPDVFIAIGWDGMQVMIAALEKATEFTRAGVQKALTEIKDLQAVAGIYTYSATNREGTDASSLIWLKVVDGKLARSANP